MAYEVDLNDKRLTEITDKEANAKQELTTTYDNAINNSQDYYNKQIEAAKDYAEEQKKNQQEQTDFAIKEINQQKEQANKDYIKEQSGAYVDWQKEKDSYGAGAEQRAAAGLAGAGYSESAQVSLYNTYQNRVATAREAYGRAILNYDNAIQKAIMQNSSILAEIAYTALQKELELSLQGFQYKNQLILEKADKLLSIESMYNSQYMQMYNQLFQEEQFKYSQEQARKEEEYRQAQLALEREKFAYQKEQDAKDDVVVKKPESNNTGSVVNSVGRNTANEKIVNKYGKKDSSGFTGTTYKEAVEYLEKNGVGDYNIMPVAEWLRKKNSHELYGIGGYEVSANETYQQYLKTSVDYAIKNK